MSIAKKSVKWLVALFVIFALILTASIAVTGATTASAEPVADVDVNTSVIVEATDSAGDAYPDLNPTSGSRTITVNYFVEIPTAAADGEYSILKFAPFITYPNLSVKRPDTITLNSAFGEVAALQFVTGNNEGYLDENGASNFMVALKAGHTIGELNGVSSGETISNAYLFTATYVLSTSTAGEYRFGFYGKSGNEYNSEIASESEGTSYIPVISNQYFYIREFVEIPTYAGHVYDGESHGLDLTGITAYEFATGTRLRRGGTARGWCLFRG